TTEATTTTTEATTTTTDEAVEGIEVEETTTTAEAEVAGEVVEALPRTGAGTTGTTLVAIAALLSGAALLATVRRRQLVS
ncbi:MAG: LPXTG cell wall anchor domain-containing protein, partial [Acidimicrobiales bacterium]